MNDSDRAKMDEITSHEIKQILYVATITASVPSQEMEPLAVEHLEYMAKINESGQIFASGPFPAPRALFADGMTIFATKTIEEANAIMVRDANLENAGRPSHNYTGRNIDELRIRYPGD